MEKTEKRVSESWVDLIWGLLSLGPLQLTVTPINTS